MSNLSCNLKSQSKERATHLLGCKEKLFGLGPLVAGNFAVIGIKSKVLLAETINMQMHRGREFSPNSNLSYLT